MRVTFAEGLARLFSLAVLVMTACIEGLNEQTELLVIENKATAKDISSVWVLVIVASAAGGYQFLQFCKCLVLGTLIKSRKCNKWEGWVSLALDLELTDLKIQAMVYMVLAATAAATQGSLVAVTGQDQLQWMKLCNIYTRFCYQVGGGLVCALAASGAMTIVAIISAHELFSLYSSKFMPSFR